MGNKKSNGVTRSITNQWVRLMILVQLLAFATGCTCMPVMVMFHHPGNAAVSSGPIQTNQGAPAPDKAPAAPRTDGKVSPPETGDEEVFTESQLTGDQNFDGMPEAPAASSGAWVQRTFALVNQARADAGVAPLRMVQELNDACAVWSRSMARSGVLEHDVDGAGFTAENCARDFRSPEDFVRWYLGSPGHRRNILNPAYTEFGTGYEGRWNTMRFR